MRQLEIDYFFPLTEQISLDLDFTESNVYDEKKQQEMFKTCIINMGECNSVLYSNTGSISSSITIYVDETPITVVSDTKPNFVKRWIYRSLGIKWKNKC